MGIYDWNEKTVQEYEDRYNKNSKEFPRTVNRIFQSNENNRGVEEEMKSLYEFLSENT